MYAFLSGYESVFVASAIMPKVSSQNCYSKRHIRRLRDNLTKLDLKRLNSTEENTEDLRRNKNVDFSEIIGNDYDYIPTDVPLENENEYTKMDLDEEDEIDNAVITQRKEEEEEVKVGIEVEGEIGVEEEVEEEEDDLEKLLNFDFEFEDDKHNISDSDDSEFEKKKF